MLNNWGTNQNSLPDEMSMEVLKNPKQ